MNIPSKKISKKENQSPAFSLVLSLAIMAMIVVIVLSLAAFLTIELKSSSLFSKQMIARQNALTGARIALGKIQQLAGPDRRVSAPGVFAIESARNRRNATDETLANPHWSGIWNTIDSKSARASNNTRPFYVSYHEELSGLGISDAFLTDSRNQNGTYVRPDVMEWLVTQVPNQDYTPETTPSANWVNLLSYKNKSGNNKQVLVPYLGFNEDGVVTQQLGATGGFAYWVSDEGTKARVNLHDPRKNESTSSQEGFYRAIAPAANNIKLVQTPDGHNAYQNFDTTAINDRLGEILTLSTMAFLDFGGTPSENAKYIKENFLDLTEVSSGVLASSAHGGLLSDLTAFLHTSEVRGKISSDSSVTPSRPGLNGDENLILSSSGHENSGPYFSMLKTWYDAPILTFPSKTIDPSRYIQDQVEVSSDTELRTWLYPNKGAQRSWTTGEKKYPRLKRFDQQSTNRLPLFPVLVESRLGFDFGYWWGEDKDRTAHPGRVRGLRTYVYPQVALWNPYSAPIKSSKPYLIIFHAPSQLRLRILKGNLQTWPRGGGRSSRDFLQRIPTDAATWADALDENTGKGFQGGNYGDFFHFVLDGSFTIPPGEVLVYRSADRGALEWKKYPLSESLNSDNVLKPQASLLNNAGSFRFTPGYTETAVKNGFFYFQEVGVDASKSPGVPIAHLTNATYSIQRTGWTAAYNIKDNNSDNLDNGAATTLTYPHVSLKLKTGNSNKSGSGHPPPYMEFVGLQRLNLSPGGERPVVLENVVPPTDHASYDTSFWLPATSDSDSGFFREYEDLEQRRKNGEPPPAGFQIGYRMIRFNEEDESSIIINGKPRFDNAINISPFTFNVRSPIVMRIPNAYWDSNDGSMEGTGSTYRKAGWLNNLVTGLYLIEWYPRQLWGDSKYDPVVGSDGLLHGAPFSVFSKANTEGKIIAFDFPDRDYALTSLADFRHAMLSPFVWHPTYVVGNSHMDPLSDPHRTINRTLHKSGPGLWKNLETNTYRGRGGFGHLLGGKGSNDTGRLDSTDILLYNIAFEVNHQLFDNFFLSTLLTKREKTSTWDGVEALPNARLKLHKSISVDSVELSQAKNDLDKMYHTASSILVNEGAFNVNSTSVEAWVAFLSSTLNVNRPLKSGGEAEGSVQFSKLLRPFKAGKPSKDLDEKMGTGIRALSEAEVRTLAEKIVEEVKFRGPFLSLSDFINRRLVGRDVSRASQVKFPSEDDISMALQGALDAAIEKAAINAEDASDSSVGDENSFALADISEGLPNGTMNDAYVGAFPRRKSQNLAGWLTQMDILSTLGPAMTARSDTFKIRVYGDSKSPSNIQPDAVAYLEIIVQRQPSFYDTSDSAHTPVTLLYDGSGDPNPIPEENTSLKSANRQFGRKFEIVSLRWLSPNEI